MRKKFLFYLPLLLFLVFAAAPSYGGQATLCWDPPTTNADGTPLTDLGGYNIYYGTSSGNYTMTENMHLGECTSCPGSSCSTCSNVPNPCTYLVTSLSEGTTFYFVATAYDTSDNESGYSNEVSKTIQTTTLTVSKTGSGSGTVTSSPAGINCGSTCSANFNAGTVITLTATAASGSTFTGWTDGSTYKGSGTYSFSLNASKAVSANFTSNASLRYLLWASSGTARVWFLDSSDNYLGFKDFSLDTGETPIGFSMDSTGGTLATYISSTKTTRLRQLDANYNLTGYHKDYASNWIGKSHALNKLLWYYTSTNTSKVWTMDSSYNRTSYKDYILSGLPVSYCNTGGGTGAIVVSSNILQHLDASGNLTSSTSWITSWMLKGCAASRLVWYYPSNQTTRIWTTNASDGRVSSKDYPSGSWMPVSYSIFGQ